MALLQKSTELEDHDRILKKDFDDIENHFRLTPYIVTFCEGTISEIDIRNFLEAGLQIVRFKITHIPRKDKMALLATLKKAISWCCRKYEASTWPVAIFIDLPNACIRTGYIKEEFKHQRIYLEEGKIVEITCEIKYWNQCDDKKIFIDDPYTLEKIKPNTEISIDFGGIVMVCTEVISNLSIKCKVIYGGYLKHGQFVCLRGVKLLKPALGKLDYHLLEFVKEYKLDVVSVYSIRTAKTLVKVREFFAGSKHVPMVMSTICEQEGLDNLDEIIALSDGIILAREFLAQSLLDDQKLITIQLYVSAKCRQLGKPFYLSGNILDDSLKWGTVTCREINDLTNAVLQGAGLVLKSYGDASHLLTTMKLINSVCKSIETVSTHDHFWRLCMELKPPVTAADAAVLACAMTARQSQSSVVVVLTVTGRTAMHLAHVGPEAVILSVSASPRVARRLQLYRGIIPIIYDTDANITPVDIQKMMEAGMNVARFKMSHTTRGEKQKILGKVDKAALALSKKHGLTDWPIATCVDLKTCIVKTGLLKEDVNFIPIKEGNHILLTCNLADYDSCTEEKVFVDNAHLTTEAEIGMEISIKQEELILHCTEIVNNKTIKCIVSKGGNLTNMDYVSMRGIKRQRPVLAKRDYQIIKFAIENQVDIIIINYVREAGTLNKIKRFIGRKVKRPILISGICTQEGLDNIDGIAKESDAILLCREFLPFELEPSKRYKLSQIQKWLGAKCQSHGKPYYISGGVLNSSLRKGEYSDSEVSDVTNALLDGANGFVLKDCNDLENYIDTIKSLNELCLTVEPYTNSKTNFWRVIDEMKLPLNAAEACVMSCAAVANQIEARVIVMPTVTGTTAKALMRMKPACLVITVSSKPTITRLLHTFRCIVPLMYKVASKGAWYLDLEARVHFAIEYAVHKGWLTYGDPYVTLQRASEDSSFCDMVRMWTVTFDVKPLVECSNGVEEKEEEKDD